MVRLRPRVPRLRRRREPPARKLRPSFGFLDVVTPNIGKITALVAGIGTLAVAVAVTVSQVRRSVPAILTSHSPPEHSELCLNAKLSAPSKVSVRQWHDENNLPVALDGKSTCREGLPTHVSFEVLGGGGRIKAEPPRPESCKRPPDPREEAKNPQECWLQYYLDQGVFHQELAPPRLVYYDQALTSFRVYIFWTAYDDHLTIVGHGETNFELVRDTPSATASSAARPRASGAVASPLIGFNSRLGPKRVENLERAGDEYSLPIPKSQDLIAYGGVRLLNYWWRSMMVVAEHRGLAVSVAASSRYGRRLGPS